MITSDLQIPVCPILDIELICTVNSYVNFNLWVSFLETCRNPLYQQNSGLSHPPADSKDREGRHEVYILWKPEMILGGLLPNLLSL